MGQKAKIKKAIKEVKEKKLNKDKLWKKAKAVKASAEDYRLEIKGKQLEMIKRQKEYEEAYLIRRKKEARLYCLKQELEKVQEGQDKMFWQGGTYHVAILESEYNLELFYYKQTIAHEKYLKQALENYNFTEEEIKNVLKGKYRKTLPDGAKPDKNNKEEPMDYTG